MARSTQPRTLHRLRTGAGRRRLRTMIGVGAALATAATASVTVAPAAQAASMPTVTSPSCGTVSVNARYYTGPKLLVMLDAGLEMDIAAGQHGTLATGLPTGRYTYWQLDENAGAARAGATVWVSGCSGSGRRAAEGDEDGDGVADVFGVTRGGALIYYRMLPAGLQTVKTVFSSGFDTTTWIQRVTEVGPSDGKTANYTGPRALFAMRSDGTLWRYIDHGAGRLDAGQQIGSGFAGQTRFMISPTNSTFGFGGHRLLTVQGDILHGQYGLGRSSLTAAVDLGEGWSTTRTTVALKDVDGNGFADYANIYTDGTLGLAQGTYDDDTIRIIGHGWGAMQIVASPGDLTGDGRSDLVARRADGNLYRYASTGNGFGPAVQIGRNWGGITCLG